jgi:hypothetical protein
MALRGTPNHLYYAPGSVPSEFPFPQLIPMGLRPYGAWPGIRSQPVRIPSVTLLNFLLGKNTYVLWVLNILIETSTSTELVPVLIGKPQYRRRPALQFSSKVQ